MKNIIVTFQKHDGTTKRTENISLDVKLSEFRKAAQRLLCFPDGLPFVLILDRTKKELRNDGTFKDAEIQQDDKIILYPLVVWEKQKDKFVPFIPKAQSEPIIISISPKTEPEIRQPKSIPKPEIKPKPENINQPRIATVILRVVGVKSAVILKSVKVIGTVILRLLKVISTAIIGLVGLTVAVIFFISVYPNLFKESPEQSIKNYYLAINSRKLPIAWQNLSPEFKKNSVGTYSKYLNRWGRQVERVELNQVKLVSKNPKSAVVEVKLQYLIKKTKRLSPPESLRLWLVWDDQNSKWMINKSKRIYK